MGKFINPFTDVGFKRIFGQEFSKPMLLDFLNSLLRGERCITALTLHDKEQLAEIAEVSAMSKEERQEYDGALKRYRDTLNVMRGAEQKGRAEGRAEVVKVMRAKGYADEDIMMITGISREELERI
ncbi:MAG: PD-(D/E)XK nuclease family transposase [Prevotella sp.]|nr:PD-(D/E)XK nuclease family transposase [Prevotella sp.]